ncbi:MAG: hypothetical protein ACRC8P_00510 [Spiroplasma sp.]
MKAKKEAKTRIEVKRIGIRGDEVAILFFSLVFLAFLFISFFRLFAIGKLFDDFIFIFLFGWTKYLVYLVLFSFILPICFNYYFRLKLSFILAMFFSFIAVSWLVANIVLIINTTNFGVDIWSKINPYDFNHLSSYFQKWWDTTIINNYHGFLSYPLSFNSWTDINSFFPVFASGGIIANSLIAVCNYGFFITNWVLNLIVLFIAISWVVFAKPWFLFIGIFVLFKPIKTYFKAKKISNISKKSSERKEFLDTKENNKLESSLLPFKKNASSANKVQKAEIVENSFKKTVTSVPKANKKEILIRDVIQESGTLTPFGQVKKELEIEKADQTSNKIDKNIDDN